MSRSGFLLLLCMLTTGCSTLRIRVVDDVTGLPLPNKKVSSMPWVIGGLDPGDHVTTDGNGIAELRNRYIHMSVIHVDGCEEHFHYEEIKNGDKPPSRDSVRVEYVDSRVGWPFRRPNWFAR